MLRRVEKGSLKKKQAREIESDSDSARKHVLSKCGFLCVSLE